VPARLLPDSKEGMGMAKATSSINDMHVVIDLAGERRAVGVATELARQVEAHLTGVALAFEPIVPMYTMGTPVPTDLIIAAHDRAVEDAKAATAAFERSASLAGIRFASRMTESIGGEGLDNITRGLALSDLIVIGQQNPDAEEPMREALIESVLFHAGAPALLVPYTGVREFKPGRAVVAWDGGSAAAHAVHAALPLLRLTKEVVVVIVEESRKRPAQLAGADIATHLARHDLHVEVRDIPDGGGNIGQTILNFVADESADWLVMGAFGHTRFREFFLGGATRTILSSMTLPVLMTH
jgi:nucleotide-binding universal stress UspA family protein